MSKTGYGAIVLSVTTLLSGCAIGPNVATSPGREPSTSAAVEDSGESDTTATTAALRRILSDAVDDRSEWDSLHLQIECSGDHGMRSVELYGNGVGIWEYRRQFTLANSEVSSILRTLDEADFASFADIYGGSKQPDAGPPEEEVEPGHAIRVICRVVLSLAGETKQVVQLAKGAQSAELKQMAEDVLAICEKPGQAGTAAADLTDGLEKISRGELAPETLQVLLHHKPEKAGVEAGGDGFVLRLSGPRATRRGSGATAAVPDSLSLILSPADVSELARELASLNLGQLPINLFAPDYTDLSVAVLNHKKSVQARQFDGMTPTTHGEHQGHFDLIYDRLYQLQVRVAREGEPPRETGG